MTGSDGVLMGRAELERAFTRLGERLVRRGVVADICVVGRHRAADVVAQQCGEVPMSVATLASV